MKKWKSRIILLSVAILLAFAGTTLTYAILKENTSPLTNSFTAAHIFEVEYDLNGASGTAPNTQRKIDIPNPEEPCVFIVQDIDDDVSYPEHKFMGWAKTSDAQTAQFQPGDKISLATTEYDAKLYAVWEVRHTFTLNYDLNSPDGTDAPVWTITYPAEDSRTSHNFIAIDNLGHTPTYEPEGYAFLGWSTEAGSTQIDYSKNKAIPVAFNPDTQKAEKTLYAVWEETVSEEDAVTYNLLFEMNLPESFDTNLVTIPQNITKLSGDSCNFGPFSATVDENYQYETGLEFAGWATTSDGLVEYTDKDRITLEFDSENYTEGDAKTVTCTLYAKWNWTYYAMFNNVTARSSSDTLPLSFKSEVYAPLLITSLFDRFAEAGGSSVSGDYKLSGFSLAANSDVLVSSATVALPGEQNALQLYANWITCDYIVYFHANEGGIGGPEKKEIQSLNDPYTFNLEDDLLTNIPTTIDGVAAKFLGWATVDTVGSASDPRILLPYDPDADVPHFTKTSISGLLTSQNPTLDLYAVWEYTYSLTYDPGRGTFKSGENYTTSVTSFAHSYTFDVDIDYSVYVPQRDGYEFLKYWSDQYERLSGERKYYHTSQGSGFRTTVELSAKTATIKTVYARFRPLGQITLEYRNAAVLENNTPSLVDTRYINATSIWPARFSVDTSIEPPARTGYTFIGWSLSQDADYTWLNNRSGDQRIFGGKGFNTIIPVDTDVSKTGVVYAVWAPNHTLTLNLDTGGAYGMYQLSVSYTQDTNGDGCDETYYRWAAEQRLYSEDYKTASKTITFNDYAQLSEDGQSYSFKTTVSINYTTKTDTWTNANATVKPNYRLVRPGMKLKGFYLDPYGTGTAYQESNTTEARNPTNAASEVWRSSGVFEILNVQLPVENPDPKTPQTYPFTLYALWKTGYDYYQILIEDPEYGQTTTLLHTRIDVDDGSTSVSYPANYFSPHRTVEGRICDYYATVGGRTVEYPSVDIWTPYYQDTSVDISSLIGGQTWKIGPAITISANDPSTYSYASQDPDSGAWTYTLHMHAVWSDGQIFRLRIDYSLGKGTMYRLEDASIGRTFTSVSSVTRTVVARADLPSYTWDDLGLFYGNQHKSSGFVNSSSDNTSYQFMGGFSATDSDTDFSVPYPVTSSTYARSNAGTTRTQYYHRFNDPITIDANPDSPKNGNGIPVHTLTLYPVYRPWKAFRVVFDTNGADSSYRDSLEIGQKTYGTRQCTFSASSSNSFTKPKRPGYLLLGYNFAKQTADQPNYVDEAVTTDLTPVANGENNIYLKPAFTVYDPDAVPEGEYRDAVENTSSGPHRTTTTLYAVWQRFQEYSITFDFNGGTYTPSSGDPISECTSDELVELGKAYHDMTATPAYKPTNDNYTLIGYSYKPVNPGEGSVDNTDFILNSDGSIGPVHIDQVDSEDPEVTVTTADSTTFTNLRLYAVWAVNYTNYHLQIMTDDPDPVDVPLTENALGNTYTYPANSLYLGSKVTKYGYRLAGLATEEGGDPVYTVTNGYVQEDLEISEANGATKEFIDNVNKYTLTLYPIWEKQDLFEVILMPNSGSIMNSDNSSFSTEERKLTLSTSRADTGTDAVTISTAYFQAYENTLAEIYTREKYTFAGYSLSADWAEDMTFDFTSTTTGSAAPYRHSFSNIIIDRSDPNIEKRPSETDADITIYTVRIYLVWEPVRYFQVQLYPNGGTFYSDPDNTIDFYTYVSDPQRYATESIDITPSYTDYYTPDLTYPGYKLIGFAYAETGEEDFGITTDGTKVTLDKVSITRTDENTSDDEFEITTIKLYAVWGLQVDYISQTDTTNMPENSRSVIYVPDALTNKTFDIPAVRPVYQQYIFAGWATSETGSQEYGHYPEYEPFNEVRLKETYTFGQDGNPVSHGKLYAKWTQKFSVYYIHNNADNQDDAPDPDFIYAFNENNTVAIGLREMDADKPLVREGYRFLGWSTDENATEPMYTTDPDDAYPDEFEVKGNSDGRECETFLYAVWVPDETSTTSNTYNLSKDGDSNAPTDPEPTEPVETEPVETEPVDDVGEGSAIERKFELIYDANGGDKDTLPDNVTEYSTESSVTVAVKFRNEDSDPLPAREGYTFLGWAEKADAVEAEYVDGDYVEIEAGENGADAVKTLYAVWAEEPEPVEPDPTEPPATEPPATEPPATEPPATEPPATEPPATEPPATEPPATEPPATEPPATEPPATEPPATEPPATEPPATEPPATKPPATEPPATEPPATEPPVTSPPDNADNTGGEAV